ncbi:hypothetical protein [Microseira wollei]|uniref:Uncharacterized protein n=1 Tax=Microseira wollei NIES-4236 TaxID=2530354 RepID=A0AAV3X9G0_9CYAN|nr:hypothetical protein [Microseira wollei]GET35982.1 hypothetical protein MiSe_07300 [Microseira wollei NIES-4236]
MELDIHKRPKTVDASAPDPGTITSDNDIDVPHTAKSDVQTNDNDRVSDPFNQDSSDRIATDQIHIVGRTPG